MSNIILETSDAMSKNRLCDGFKN